MHDIISIESIKLTAEEDIQFIAILENMDASHRTKQYLTVPDVAPVKCRTLINRASLPHWLNLKDLDEEGLQEIVNRYGSLSSQSWEVLVPKFRDHTRNNTPG
jgi:hypothetical protein